MPFSWMVIADVLSQLGRKLLYGISNSICGVCIFGFCFGWSINFISKI